MISGIHHIALNTENIDRLIEFYRYVIGMELIRQGEFNGSDTVDHVVGLKQAKAKNAMLSVGNCYIELFQYSSPEACNAQPLRPCDRGYTHFCLDVTDIESEYVRLTERGMRFNSAPADFGGLKSAYGYDPEGNIIEIQEITDPSHEISMSRLHSLRGQAN